MTHGPGKYDALATHVRKKAKARGVVLIVLDGEKGSGFSVQGGVEVHMRLTELLRIVADEIDRDTKGTPQ